MATPEEKNNLKEKKIKLKGRKVVFAAASMDTKMLTIKMDKLDPCVAMIVCAVCVRMLKCLAAELEMAEKEAVGEEEPATE